MADVLVTIPDSDLPDVTAGMARRLGEEPPTGRPEQTAIAERYLTQCAQDAWSEYRSQKASEDKRQEDAGNPWLHTPKQLPEVASR